MRVELVQTYGSDLLIANAARVSHDKWHEGLQADDVRLLDYLARHGHVSPFFHAGLTVRIQAPIFVARQLMRSQVGLAVNEVSRRYVRSEPELWEPDRWRAQAVQVKQGSSGPLPRWRQALGFVAYRAAVQVTQWSYRALLALGCCGEQARAVLPQAMLTTWLWTGSLAAFHRVCKLRQAPDAQRESKVIADAIAVCAGQAFPSAWTALIRHG